MVRVHPGEPGQRLFFCIACLQRAPSPADTARSDGARAAVKLAAIKDALDRAGVSARTAVSVEVGRPYEVIFDDIVGGSRAESRRRRGIPDDDESDVTETINPLAFAGGDDNDPIMDAELVGAEYDDSLPGSNTDPSDRLCRRTYTFGDSEPS